MNFYKHYKNQKKLDKSDDALFSTPYKYNLIDMLLQVNRINKSNLINKFNIFLLYFLFCKQIIYFFV